MDRAHAAGLIAFYGGVATVTAAVALATSAPETGALAPAILAILGAAVVAVGGHSKPSGGADGREDRPGPVLLAAAILPAACLVVAARLAAGDGLLARDAAVAILSWLAAIAVAAFSIYALAPRGEPSRALWRRTDLAALVLIFAAALAIRAVAIDRIPRTFGGDEGSGGLDAVAFATGAADNIFALGWYSFPSLFFAVESLGVVLDGHTVGAIRWIAAIGGSLTVVAAVLLGRVAAGPLAGWIAGGFLAASHFHLQFSRIALANVWDGFFAAVSTAALLWGWRSGNRAAFVLCGLALGLGQYFYVSMRVMPLVLLAWCAIARLADPATFSRRRGGLLGAVCVAAAVAGPLALLFLARPDEFMAPFRRVTIFGHWMETEIAAGGRSAGAILFDQVAAAAAGFITRPFSGDFYNPGAPMLLPFAALLFVLGLALAVLRPRMEHVALVLPIAAVLAATAFSLTPPAPQRMVMAAPFVAVVLALPLAAAAVRFRRGAARRLAICAVFAVVAIVATAEARFYFLVANDRYVMGGRNTEVATELASYLTGPGAAIRNVIFIGRPRMGYASHATVPYLAPGVAGIDQVAPLTEPPTDRPSGPTAFVLLPERGGELSLIRAAFPGGRLHEIVSHSGEPLFTIFEID